MPGRRGGRPNRPPLGGPTVADGGADWARRHPAQLREAAPRSATTAARMASRRRIAPGPRMDTRGRALRVARGPTAAVSPRRIAGRARRPDGSAVDLPRGGGRALLRDRRVGERAGGRVHARVARASRAEEGAGGCAGQVACGRRSATDERILRRARLPLRDALCARAPRAAWRLDAVDGYRRRLPRGRCASRLASVHDLRAAAAARLAARRGAALHTVRSAAFRLVRVAADLHEGHARDGAHAALADGADARACSPAHRCRPSVLTTDTRP